MFKRQFPKAISFLLLYSFLLTNAFLVQTFAEVETKETNSLPTLDRFATDLTRLAREGKIRPGVNFERETNNIFKILTGGARQPVILDETGESQELVAEALAARLAAENVPSGLRAKRLLKLEVASVFTKDRSESELRTLLENVCDELSASKTETILFVDELTNFVGARAANEALVNALAGGKVRIVGGASKAGTGRVFRAGLRRRKNQQRSRKTRTQTNVRTHPVSRRQRLARFARDDGAGPDRRQPAS